MFKITDEQREKIREWADKINEEVRIEQGRDDQAYYGAIGGSLTYCFTPTSIGIIVVVKHARGDELDITDYDGW